MSNLITKKAIIEQVAESQGLTKIAAKSIIDCFIEEVEKELSTGNRVQLNNFGTFDLRERAARKGKNPQTGESIDIPATKSFGFKIAAPAKRKLNQ